jgi:O-acetyl-ADP-ribose deacetylase (regulator of RNase III)
MEKNIAKPRNEMKIVVLDKNKHFIDVFAKLVGDFPDFTCMHADIVDINRDDKVFISPANSLGFMDGGIDMRLSRSMFPGVEQRVKAQIKMLGLKTALNRYYLPIGSAIAVPVNETSILISAPTMFLPHDVSDTQNAYHAFMAVLCLYVKLGYHDKTIVCPGLCIGYGKMNHEVAAAQMVHVYNDFCRGDVPNDLAPDMCNVYITKSVNHTQPSNFDNREIHVPFPIMNKN